jgi:hypothetical protein
MAFLLSDQNQGTRNDAPREMRRSRPFSFIRTLTVGFGFTPNLLTLLPTGIQDLGFQDLGFPDKKFQEKKALAGLGCFTLTAGGDFHPALRTIQFARILVAKPVPTFAEYARPSNMDDLKGTMPKRRGASKHLPIGNPHVPHDARARLRARHQREIRPGKIND